jgi:VanZ family protein
MPNRAIMLILAAMAAIVWLGLVAFMNRRPPDSLNQAIFLVIFGVAVSCTMIPLSFALNARIAPRLGKARDLTRAIRQGVLVGALGMILMTLRFLRLLNWFTVVVLSLVVVLVEALIYLRSRY